jgi:hypothetical protein
LPNDALISLKPKLQTLETPVVVTRETRWVPEQGLRAARDELKVALENWRRSVESRDLYAYLANYDPSFSARGLDRGDWARFRMDSFAATGPARATLDDLLLLADPEEPGLYLARFRLILEGEDTVSYRKRLYWRRGADGLRIVTEDAG